MADLNNEGCVTYGREDVPEDAKEVEIPYGVTRIEGAAFYAVLGNDVEQIIIPDTVQEIGEFAFGCCEKLKSIIIPPAVKSLANHVFYGCGELAHITVPEGLTEIGISAFRECTSLKSIAIPDGVTTIGEGAFSECESLEEVVIPPSVTKIGPNAFERCLALENAVINGRVSGIKESTFSECVNLRSVTLPSSVRHIGRCAFYGCESLESIELFEYVSFDSTAFVGCPSLADENGFVIFRDVVCDYVGTAADAVIPDGVKELGDSAFFNCEQVRSVTVPDGVTKFSGHSFYNCPNLERVTLPSSVRCIGRRAFGACPKLRKITLPEEFNEEFLKYLWRRLRDSDRRAVLAINLLEQYPQQMQSPLWKKRIKTCKQEIAERAVATGNTTLLGALFSLRVMPKLEDFDRWLEQSGDNLELRALLMDYKNKIYTPKRLAKIESDRVEKELGLKTLSVDELRKVYNFYFKKGGVVIKKYISEEVGRIVIPDKIGNTPVTDIADEAFDCFDEGTLPTDVADITEIILPKDLKTIGEGAFRCCAELKRISIPHGVTKIGQSAFACCMSLERIELPDGITSIEENTFEACVELAEIVVPDGVTVIGDYAFIGCCEMKRAYIPASVTSIGHDVFSDCHELTIYAPQGSYAEQYARENNIKFVAE